MCRWLKDVLFPTNVLGKKKQCAVYDFNDMIPPIIPGPHHPWDDQYQFTVEWSGKMLNFCYTQANRTGIGTNMKIEYVPVRQVFLNGEETTETILTPNGAIHLGTGSWVNGKLLYFNCTNVTKLIVNGEQLI